MRKIFINASAAIAGFLVVLPLPALAQEQGTGPAVLPRNVFLQPITGGNATEMIKEAIYKVGDWLLGLAGALAVVYLIWGGIQYITGGSKGAEAGKGIIINAIIGIIIILLTYAIISAIRGFLGARG